MVTAAALTSAFAHAFGGGEPPRLYRAPGRINLIGEHTDYNDGWVMPGAIDLDARVAMGSGSAGAGRRLRVRSRQYAEGADLDLDAAPDAAAVPAWGRSIAGIAWLLEREGHRLPGGNLYLDSAVPIGAGLSSSAAVEVACALAITASAGVDLNPTALAQLCQQASHEFGGARCGIMDFHIAVHGRAGHVLQLDTRSLDARALAWPEALSLIVCNTGVRHDNARNEYNLRRQQCEEAVRRLRRPLPHLTSLRDLAGTDWTRYAAVLDDTLFARCRHVVSENARVLAAAAALEQSDFAELGRLLLASHQSLRDDYEVSCVELDLMVELCRRQPQVYGARMMGGGFGGSVLALAAPTDLDELCRRVAADYAADTGITPELRVCRLVDGAGPLTDGMNREGDGSAPAL